MEWLIGLLPVALIIVGMLVMHLFMRGAHGGHGGHAGGQHIGEDSSARIADLEEEVADLRAKLSAAGVEGSGDEQRSAKVT